MRVTRGLGVFLKLWLLYNVILAGIELQEGLPKLFPMVCLVRQLTFACVYQDMT